MQLDVLKSRIESYTSDHLDMTALLTGLSQNTIEMFTNTTAPIREAFSGFLTCFY